MNRPARLLTTTVLVVVTAGALSSCSQEDAASADGDDLGTVTVGFLPSWTDAVNNAYLLEDQLTKLGYTVELEELSSPAVLYTALAEGTVDVYPSAWSDISQAQYIEKYGDDLEDLGTYYGNAHGTLAVPDYVDIDSVEDLRGQADRFGGKIYTIEPGSGTATMAEENLFPAYDLGGEYELVPSSLAAMLATLESAVADQEDIVVTLWRPFWAYDAYGLKDLEDPEEGMGATEGLHFMAHKGFSEEFPEAADLIGQIELDDAQYGALENAVVNEFGAGEQPEAIDQWVADHAGKLDWIIE
ncbi:glycine/betaine ABC transporter substrate-binding protein [Microbacterium nanhaiense]|uniref:Glycine/betaine ABC transporter substrate-binding protein n=1 Tax=Microbacterium nanhaiense TaxID=1301026 RepID=A0ABQ2N0P1_9MICO|nr:glycine betaine ABC transporter substrate-binding protein [Microbacterium nanhaiense]GGO61640.1 glycine/betaine ABC transporter substrate-binding protein [Microbacterium nanhaiense]